MGDLKEKHISDCAIHNEPAYPAEDCDCGASTEEPCCRNVSPDGWLCTRPVGHTGQHRAYNPLSNDWYGEWPSELKPCPHCGGEAEMVNGVNEWWVQCGCVHMASTEEEAIEAWNTRTVSTEDSDVETSQ